MSGAGVTGRTTLGEDRGPFEGLQHGGRAREARAADNIGRGYPGCDGPVFRAMSSLGGEGTQTEKSGPSSGRLPSLVTGRRPARVVVEVRAHQERLPDDDHLVAAAQREARRRRVVAVVRVVVVGGAALGLDLEGDDGPVDRERVELDVPA